MPPEELPDHDRGLSHDLPILLSRRRALSVFGGAGLAAALAGCGLRGDDTASQSSGTSNPATPANSPSASTGTGDTAATGDEIPAETGGPYPADGSNGVNVLTDSGIVRRDITRSFGSASGVAEGVPLTIRLRVLNVSEDAQPLAGAAIYLWHCTREGGYSLYSAGLTAENFLRGVQEAGADGSVTFTSFFPGAYSGRWPHIHFEVYPSLSAATSASGKLRTSQLALPEDACRRVYATEGYEESLGNLAQTSLDTDNVFIDGYSLQLASVTGDATSGMVATLNVPV